jgi:hypothetical protein
MCPTAGPFPLITRMLDRLLPCRDGHDHHSLPVCMRLRIQFQAGVATLGPTVGPVSTTLSFNCGHHRHKETDHRRERGEEDAVILYPLGRQTMLPWKNT